MKNIEISTQRHIQRQIYESCIVEVCYYIDMYCVKLFYGKWMSPSFKIYLYDTHTLRCQYNLSSKNQFFKL